MIVQATNALYHWIESKTQEVGTRQIVEETASLVNQLAQTKVRQACFDCLIDGIVIGAIVGGVGAYKLHTQLLKKDSSAAFVTGVFGALIIVGSIAAGGAAGASFGVVKAINFHS
jgi:hypothetical protein